MSQVSLSLLGRFRLTGADGQEIVVTSQKARALLALLATAPNGERERIMLRGLLWERSGRQEQLDSLTQELSRLRKALAQQGAAALLRVDRQRVRLDLARLWIDLRDPAACMASDAADLLSDLDLPGCLSWYRWLQDERERLRAVGMMRSIGDSGSGGASVILGTAVPSSQELLTGARVQRPPKPSVAVLPFDAAAPEDRGLGLALADDLATRLAHFPQIFVGGSSSAASLASIGLLPSEIAERLGVRYLVGGLLLRLEGRMRVSVRLIDGDSGEQIWGDVFMTDGSNALEQNIANHIAPRIWSKVDLSERDDNARRFGFGSSLYERWWQANAMFRSFESHAVLNATGLANALAEENPTCAFCNALAAFLNGLVHLLNLSCGDYDPGDRADALSLAALRAAPDNVEVLGYCGAAQTLIGRSPQLADALVTRALVILPSYQPALFWGGWTDVASGRTARARERLELALRINPATGVRGPTLCGIGFSYLQDGRPEDALQMLREAQRSDPGFPLTYPGLLIAGSILGAAEDVAIAKARMTTLSLERLAKLFQVSAHREIFTSMSGL